MGLFSNNGNSFSFRTNNIDRTCVYASHKEKYVSLCYVYGIECIDMIIRRKRNNNKV